MKQVKFLITSILFISVVIGCQKDDGLNQLDNGLFSPLTELRSEGDYIPPLYHTVYNNFDLMNQDHLIDERLREELGQMNWQASLYFLNGDHTYGQVIVPLGNSDQSKTQALLIASHIPENPGEVNFDLVKRSDIQPFLDGNTSDQGRLNISRELMFFDFYDRQVFGDSSGEIQSFIEGTDINGMNDAQRLLQSGCECEIHGMNFEDDDEGEDEEEETDGPVDPGEPAPPNDDGEVTSNGGGSSSSGDGGGAGGEDGDNGGYTGPYGHPWDGTAYWPPPPGNGSNDAEDEEDDNSGGGGGPPPPPPEKDEIHFVRLTFDYFLLDCTDDDEVNGPEIESQWDAALASDLMSDLGLPCEDADCLVKNPSLLYELEEVKDNLNFVCEDDSEVYSDIVNELCDCNFRTCADEYGAMLKGYDWIAEDETLLNCPLVKCVYDKLLGLDNDYVCSTLGEIFDSESFHLKLIVSDTDQNGELIYANGTAEYISETNTTLVHINVACSPDDPYYDNYSEMDIAKTILHEMQHASWFKEMLDAGLDPYDYESFAEMWAGYEDYLYEISDDGTMSQGEIHHIVMIHIDNTIRKIAEGLYSLFGDSSLTVDHFMCSGASGLYHVMDSEYRNTFESTYFPLCGSSDVSPVEENQFHCHD